MKQCRTGCSFLIAEGEGRRGRHSCRVDGCGLSSCGVLRDVEEMAYLPNVETGMICADDKER